MLFLVERSEQSFTVLITFSRQYFVVEGPAFMENAIFRRTGLWGSQSHLMPSMKASLVTTHVFVPTSSSSLCSEDCFEAFFSISSSFRIPSASFLRNVLALVRTSSSGDMILTRQYGNTKPKCAWLQARLQAKLKTSFPYSPKRTDSSRRSSFAGSNSKTWFGDGIVSFKRSMVSWPTSFWIIWTMVWCQRPFALLAAHLIIPWAPSFCERKCCTNSWWSASQPSTSILTRICRCFSS